MLASIHVYIVTAIIYATQAAVGAGNDPVVVMGQKVEDLQTCQVEAATAEKNLKGNKDVRGYIVKCDDIVVPLTNGTEINVTP